MNVVRTITELAPRGRDVCLGIGVFDGVHLGHRQVIQRTVTSARTANGLAVIVTFDRHPNSIVAPDAAPPLIYSLPQKLRAIQDLDADVTLLLQFDLELSQQPGEAFIRNLARDVGALRSICVGADFVFGARRSGNVELLRRLGRELGFAVEALPAVEFGSSIVSSTRIREAIRGGDLETASRMLGRPYSVAGPVVCGERLGRTLGFPTANLDTTGLVLPPNGVYAARANVRDASRDAVLNIGCRPTVAQSGAPPRVEVHLPGFSEDLYGEELEATPLRKLREEAKFASVRALREQIGRDVTEAAQWLATQHR